MGRVRLTIHIGGYATAAPGSAHVTERNPPRSWCAAGSPERRLKVCELSESARTSSPTCSLSRHDNGTDRTCRTLAGQTRPARARLPGLLLPGRAGRNAGGRALPAWLNGPEGHGLFRGDGGHPHPEPAEAITAELPRTAGVAVTGVHIDELDAALTAGPRHSRDGPGPPPGSSSPPQARPGHGR